MHRLFAWLGADIAYASPPAWSGKQPTALPPGLANHSLNANAVEHGLKRFRATVTLVNEPVAQASSTSPIKDDIIMYYHNDHLGTPLFLTDEVGAIVWRREQKPFGETTLERGSVVEKLRFPGQYYDAETGLAQNWHRDYAAGIGRYVEADPIGLKSGTNPYKYSSANPVNLFDPLGLCTCKDPCPSGIYVIDGYAYGGELFVVGVKTSHLDLTCKDNPSEKCSVDLGHVFFGLGLGVGAVRGEAKGCNKKEAIDSIMGWGWGLTVYPPAPKLKDLMRPGDLDFGFDYSRSASGKASTWSAGIGAEAGIGANLTFKW